MAADPTGQRIVHCALRLFLGAGIRRTNLTEVAYQAGVTRVTVYRYFVNKQGLVRAVARWLARLYQEAAEGPADSIRDIDLRLHCLGARLGSLPRGNLLARLEEINRLYPDVYEEFRAARQAAVDDIFRQTLLAATRQRALRPGLNPEVLKAILWTAVVGLIENPALISANVPPAEIFATVTEVFRHGILTPLADNDKPPPKNIREPRMKHGLNADKDNQA